MLYLFPSKYGIPIMLITEQMFETFLSCNRSHDY